MTKYVLYLSLVMVIKISHSQTFLQSKQNLLLITDGSKNNKKWIGQIYQDKADYYDSLANEIKLQNELSVYDSIEALIFQFNVEEKSSTNVMHDVQKIFELPIRQLPDKYQEYKMLSAMYRYYKRTRLSLGWLPIRNKYEAKVYELQSELNGRHHFFNQAKVAIDPEDLNYAVFSEIYADYFSVVKLSIGSAITPQQDSEEDTTLIEYAEFKRNASMIRRVTSGGGNLVFKIEYPLLAWGNKTGQYNFTSVLSNRLAFDAPYDDAHFKGYPIHFEPALQSTFNIKGQNDVLSITTSYKLSIITGNENFYNAINKDDGKSFMLHQWSIGMVIKEKFQVNFNLFNGSPYVKDFFDSTVSVGYLFE